MSSLQTQVPANGYSAPTVADVDRIAASSQPVLRNLQITQCYSEISAAFAERTGSGANWCTFATWASKQAGQTIRKEDMKRTLEAMLELQPEIQQALAVLVPLIKKTGAPQKLEQIRQTALGTIIEQAVDQASDAVSKGNKKVFEEIAREFARFMEVCLKDEAYNKEHLENFCSQLRKGVPPEGQDYLSQAFTQYYQSFFEEDEKKKAEQQFLANLEIGFHEQTRLQPEIVASLNAANFDEEAMKKKLMQILFPAKGLWGKVLFFFQQTSLIDKAIGLLVQRVQYHHWRLLTGQIMTLTLPPHIRLSLGQDLHATYPDFLKELVNTDLRTLLASIDPTQNSLNQSGATDWADLRERLHFIADLFRCYHHTESLFEPAFTAEQIAAIRDNKIPGGRL